MDSNNAYRDERIRELQRRLTHVTQYYVNMNIRWNSLTQVTQQNLFAGDGVMRVLCRVLFEDSEYKYEHWEAMTDLWDCELHHASELLKILRTRITRKWTAHNEVILALIVDAVDAAEEKAHLLMRSIQQRDCEDVREKIWINECRGDYDKQQTRQRRMENIEKAWEGLHALEAMKRRIGLKTAAARDFSDFEDIIGIACKFADRVKDRARFVGGTYVDLWGTVWFDREKRPYFGECSTQGRRSHQNRSSQSNSESRRQADADGEQKKPWTRTEAKSAAQVLKEYNQAWEELDTSSSTIPFPARGLRRADISYSERIVPSKGEKLNWTAEDTIIANIQAFFLLGLEMKPSYWASRGQVRTGISALTTQNQILSLLTQLKKERFRWHPDKLGCRNDGKEGSNAQLRDDSITKLIGIAVQRLFEAACEW